jgi:hypothetical protein
VLLDIFVRPFGILGLEHRQLLGHELLEDGGLREHRGDIGVIVLVRRALRFPAKINPLRKAAREDLLGVEIGPGIVRENISGDLHPDEKQKNSGNAIHDRGL